jgi:hypothetical protein
MVAVLGVLHAKGLKCPQDTPRETAERCDQRAYLRAACIASELHYTEQSPQAPFQTCLSFRRIRQSGSNPFRSVVAHPGPRPTHHEGAPRSSGGKHSIRSMPRYIVCYRVTKRPIFDFVCSNMVKFQQRYQTRHGISLIPFDRLDFWTFGYPQNSAPFDPPILGGSNSVESARRQESFDRFEVACAE